MEISTTRRCAFLTMQETDGWSIDADLSFAPLADLGWHCEWLPWRTPDVRWDSWDAVYLAATWDYPNDPATFLQILETIDRSSAILVNDLELVRWNIPKTYLRDLENRGAAIVPSRWYESIDDCRLAADFDAFAADKIIVKPVIGANANDTFLLEAPIAADTMELLVETFAERPFIVQPFVANVQTDGEYSLFYIGGSYSHAIRKVPKSNDFRVQEEHGADIRPTTPDSLLRATADRVAALVEPAPLYARCDFVRGSGGEFLVMELELIEPSLYLRMDAGAALRFATAFDRHVEARRRAP